MPTLLQAADLSPRAVAARQLLLLRLAFGQAACYGFVTSGLLPQALFGSACQIEHYLLFGVSNIVPSLASVWFSLLAIRQPAGRI